MKHFGFELAGNKTDFVIFHGDTDTHESEHVIVNDTSVTLTWDSIRYLGVHMDYAFSMRPHIQFLLRKLRQVSWELKQIIHVLRKERTSDLLRYVQSCIITQLFYGGIFLTNATNSKLQQLNQSFRLVLRLLLKVSNQTPLDYLLTATSLSMPQRYFAYHASVWWYRCISLGKQNGLHQMIQSCWKKYYSYWRWNDQITWKQNIGTYANGEISVAHKNDLLYLCMHEAKMIELLDYTNYSRNFNYFIPSYPLIIKNIPIGLQTEGIQLPNVTPREWMQPDILLCFTDGALDKEQGGIGLYFHTRKYWPKNMKILKLSWDTYSKYVGETADINYVELLAVDKLLDELQNKNHIQHIQHLRQTEIKTILSFILG